MTRISVAMCTRNREAYIEEALAAIADQTRPPDELVIGDDCSEDRTRELIQRFALRAPFPVRLHINECRLGLSKNYERAIGSTTGDIIALCDDDDVWLPDKLAEQTDTLTGHDPPLLVFGDAEIVNERLETRGLRLWQAEGFTPAQRERHRGKDLLKLLVRINVAFGCTIAFRSELKAIALPIPAGWKPDWWLASIAAASGRVAWVERPLIRYRQHSGNARGAGRRGLGQQWRKARNSSLSEYKRHLAQTEALRNRLVSSELTPDDWLVELLNDKAAHLRRRIAMRERRRVARAAMVAQDLLKGHYHRYTLGFRSAFKDIAL